MDVVLIGLPGSGKTEIARTLAARHGAALVDLDAEIESEAGRPIAAIFAAEGEAGFRRLEAAVVARLAKPSAGSAIDRVIATGGGTIIEPANRWQLYRGRAVVWLDAPTAVLAQRAATASGSRPLLAGGAIAAIERLRTERAAWYAAADSRVDATADPRDVIRQIELAIRGEGNAGMPGRAAGAGAAVLLRTEEPVGRLIVGTGVAAEAVDAELRRAQARRAIVVSEPVAWRLAGVGLAHDLRDRGWPVEQVALRSGEAAKRLAVIEAAVTDLTRLGVERSEPIVAVGGGALTDAAGLAAAIALRGLPWIAVPTTLAGQLDAAIGGKTAANLETGKNLVGAFHPPLATIDDVDVLASLPARHLRAALAEAVKVGFLGEERLLERLEADGPAIVDGDPAAAESGGLAEVVERAARFKLDIVRADPREAGERIALNLGHTLAHALEAATAYDTLLHGEAVAYGLRLAGRLATVRGTASPARVARLEALLDRLDLAVEPLSAELADVVARLSTDKKRRAGRIRWVLPTDSGWTLDDRIPDAVVADEVAASLAGRATATVP